MRSPLFAIAALLVAVAAQTIEPSAAPSAQASPAPGTSASGPVYLYQFIPPKESEPEGGPTILEIDLNDQHLHPHGHISMRVRTSTDVVSVTTGSHGRSGALTEVATGEFVADNSLPGVPFIAHGMHIRLTFTATTADGRSVTVAVPVILG